MKTTQPFSNSKQVVWLAAKILGSYFNAIADAKITDELEAYYKSGGNSFATQGTITQQRAQRLVDATLNQSEDYLVGLAFTMYRTNGYGNYVYGKKLEKVLESMPKVPVKNELIDVLRSYAQQLETELETKHDYEEYSGDWKPFFGYWLENGWQTFKFAEQFAYERFGLSKKLDKKQLLQACLTVQHQNSTYNKTIAEVLLAGTDSNDPKVPLFRKASEHFEDKEHFVHSAAYMQRFAANADQLLRNLLKLRFPMKYRSALSDIDHEAMNVRDLLLPDTVKDVSHHV